MRGKSHARGLRKTKREPRNGDNKELTKAFKSLRVQGRG